MRLEIGNKVAVLDDVLKGNVVAISDNEVSVQTSDGMIFKFQVSELVKIDADQKDLSKYSDINNPLLREKTFEKKTKKSAFKKQKREVILEVDLHINQLVKSTKYLDNYDMLNIQLDAAKKKLNMQFLKEFRKEFLFME